MLEGKASVYHIPYKNTRRRPHSLETQIGIEVAKIIGSPSPNTHLKFLSRSADGEDAYVQAKYVDAFFQAGKISLKHHRTLSYGSILRNYLGIKQSYSCLE